MLFSYRYQGGDGKTIFRENAAVEPEKAQAYFSSIGQELRVLGLPVYPGVCPDGIVDSCIAATWQDSGEVFTNNYCGEGAQSAEPDALRNKKANSKGVSENSQRTRTAGLFAVYRVIFS